MKELLTIQSKLKAPKGQLNNFGKYHYRSAEDILQGLKPLLVETSCTVIVTDSIEMMGNRFYVKSTATIKNSQGETESAVGWAREPDDKKGNDVSQVTGATSSYARKYALGGLFAIDDTKDADALPPTLEQAIEEVQAATSKEERDELVRKYKCFHNNAKFKEACIIKLAQLEGIKTSKKEDSHDNAQ